MTTTHEQKRNQDPFTLGARVYRSLWALIWLLTCRWTPRPLHAWRRLILRSFGADIAARVHVYPSVRIWDPRRLCMGPGSCLGPAVDCYCQGRITIGRAAVISQRSFLCAGTHDYTDPDHPLMTRPITIGDHAWICAQALIGPGVTIGEGCVVGAGAVAMRDQPPWSVCVGNPCRVIKPRPRTGFPVEQPVAERLASQDGTTAPTSAPTVDSELPT